MNELLQKHGCSNVFTVPEGLRELMSDITREVLRAQPPKIFDFIANYLSVLIITREHGVMAVKILEDLCDCRPSLTEHLDAVGVTPASTAAAIAAIIQDEIEKTEPEVGNETVREQQILKKILRSFPVDEVSTVKVIQVARNAYREYWYRKRLLEQSLKKEPEEPWEKAAEHTLEIYKRTNPTFNELARATEKIQAAYRGYHVRRNLLTLKKKPPKTGPKTDLPGAPLDVARSRKIDLGPVINIQVPLVDVKQMFQADERKKLGIPYDTTHLLTVAGDDKNECVCDPVQTIRHTEPATPFSSASHINVGSGNKSPPESARLYSRISFAPNTPIVLGEHDSEPSKVEEEQALAPAQDASDDEVDEDMSYITETVEHTHTHTEYSYTYETTTTTTITISGAQPGTVDTTDEEGDENEA